MRWDEQTIEVEEKSRLPGYSEEAVVRNFDAPEATGIRFHEVRAKSALNRVPGAPFGFEWTVNLYRGCTHACAYCLSGDTPILLGNGRTERLAEVSVGNQVYGTVRKGSYRRYVKTRVLAHWETRKRAYRIGLEDGTELVASGDHRFLTDRGWKFVTGSEQGRARRPHLTVNNKLIGVGALPLVPEESAEFRRGYLCGIIRGDGHIGSYSYERSGRANGDVHRFRLALADSEALQRTRTYLMDAGVATDQFLFQKATANRRPITAIRTGARDSVNQIKELIRWRDSSSPDWSRGFLAGIFDAEGCNSRGVLRISNTDPEIIGRTEDALRSLGHDCVVEDRRLPNGLKCVRLRGGLPAQLRFFQAVNPAISRKRLFAGTALKSNAKLGIRSIEPLEARVRMFDITTGTGDFMANGVVSHNCFARRTHTYLDFNAAEDFEREIVVKVNAPEVLRVELARPSWKRDLVAIGTNTDPYQWCEGRYRLMPPVLEALRDTATPVSVLSKSPLVLRDLGLYKQVAERADVSVNLSVPTLDEKVWRATEPHTPHPRTRVAAVAELNRNGISSGVLVAPLMPGINDAPEQVEPIVEMAREAGATFVGSSVLHLRDEVHDVFFAWLKSKRPDLVPRYEKLYANRRAYLPAGKRKQIASVVKGWGRGGRRGRSPADRTGGRAAAEPRQPRLF